jgi:protein-S-isoprenylcysteine O-methyltransferase Ste14
MNNGRYLPPTYLFISLAAMLLLHLFAPVHQIIPYPWNAAGLVLLALGITLNLLADRAFRVYGTTVKPFEESTVLITSGTFRYSRNPMYLGLVLILTGVALLLGTPSCFIIIPVFAIIIDRVFITSEEKMLDQRFGDNWKAYKTRVRRWI